MTDLLHIQTEAHELAPGDLLDSDSSRGQLLRVTHGIVYVRADEDETVLLPGDSIVLEAGDARRIWNAGDETARVHFVHRGSGIRTLAEAA
jgi:quercetin dioxygenase-like cupin family protein